MKDRRPSWLYRGLKSLALVALVHLMGAGAGYSQTLTEQTQVQWGTLVEPTSGSETWTIDTSDGGSGTATQVAGPNLSGDYLIKKGTGPNRTLFIDVTPGAPLPGLTIGSFTATCDGSTITLPASGQPSPGTAGKILTLGATITITTAVTTGTNLPPFTITVIKE